MYQPWLLLVELIVLGATIYFFWMTQRAAATNQREIEKRVATMVKERIEAHNTAMARDVATLVKEIEETAADMRAQWTRHAMRLQDGVQRLENIETAPPRVAPKLMPTPPTFPITRPETPTQMFGDALKSYRGYLTDSKRSTTAVNRAMGYVKSFALWWGGKRYERVQVRPINHTEIDNYIEVLQTQGLRPDTVRRKMNAVREFFDWLDEYFHRPSQPATTAIPMASANGVAQSPPPSRKSLVQSLAQQGMDIRAIAAETGLERETVRILLEPKD